MFDPSNFHRLPQRTVLVSLIIFVSAVSPYWQERIVLSEPRLLFDGDIRRSDASHHSKIIICEFDTSCSCDQCDPEACDEPHLTVADIDASLCNFILFRQATPNATTLKIDLDVGGRTDRLHFYDELASFRKTHPRIRILVSIRSVGKSREDATQAYSLIAADKNHRKEFVNSTLALLQKYDFDGVDLAWYYPGLVEVENSEDDMDNLLHLIKDMRNGLQSTHLLTVTVGGAVSLLMPLKTLKRVSKLVDYILIRSYDFGDSAQKKTFHQSPLTDTYFMSSVTRATRHYKRGAPSRKLLIGIAFHGTPFRLTNKTIRYNEVVWHDIIYRKRSGLQESHTGSYRTKEGLPGYTEICRNLTTQTNWTTYFDEENKVPFARRGSWWLSFEDVYSLELKVDFAVAEGLGGIFVSSLKHDDFDGTGCKPGPGYQWDRVRYPLLRTINYRLAKIVGGGKGEDRKNISTTTRPKLTTAVQGSTTTSMATPTISMTTPTISMTTPTTSMTTPTISMTTPTTSMTTPTTSMATPTISMATTMKTTTSTFPPTLSTTKTVSTTPFRTQPTYTPLPETTTNKKLDEINLLDPNATSGKIDFPPSNNSSAESEPPSQNTVSTAGYVGMGIGAVLASGIVGFAVFKKFSAIAARFGIYFRPKSKTTKLAPSDSPEP